jgi:hypothetical protein
MMRLQMFTLLTIVTILWASCDATAIVENVDDLFVVEYDTTTFHLKPDETATLVLDVENVANETWMVALRFTRMESGYTQARIRPSLFELDANESQRVTISVQTNAKYGQSPGSSDFKITMYWGKDIVQYENTWVDEDTVEGKRRFEFLVRNDLSDVKNPLWNILYLLVIVVVVIVVGLMLIRREWRSERDRRLRELAEERDRQITRDMRRT